MLEINNLVEIYENFFDEKYSPDYVLDKIQTDTRDYLQKNNLENLILPISGGVDSALVAAIIHDMNIKSKYSNKFNLIGLSIPIENSEKHNELADWVGKKFCDEYYRINTKNIYWNISTSIIDSIDDAKQLFDGKISDSINLGNIKARLRMIVAYNIARARNGIVLSTDNLSEYLMGFWTLHGDVGDLAPIQHLSKGYIIPKLAEYLGVKDEIIKQPPSDGLGVTKEDTDEAQLGASYKIVDAIILTYTYFIGENFNVPEEIKRLPSKDFYSLIFKNEKYYNIIRRYHNTEFKRNNPYKIKIFKIEGF